MDLQGMHGNSSEAISLLENFWPKVTKDIQNLTSVNNYEFIYHII
jgi:hypothetical protein